MKERDPEAFRLIEQDINRLGQTAVAEKAGVSRQTVHTFLEGERGLSAQAEGRIYTGISAVKAVQQNLAGDLRNQALNAVVGIK
jgi:predicted DNA-binding protein (UPF0251 family)